MENSDCINDLDEDDAILVFNPEMKNQELDPSRLHKNLAYVPSMDNALGIQKSQKIGHVAKSRKGPQKSGTHKEAISDEELFVRLETIIGNDEGMYSRVLRYEVRSSYCQSV